MYKLFCKIFFIANLLWISFSFAQNNDLSSINEINDLFLEKGEIYFMFYNSSKIDLNTLTRIISIDKVEENKIYAYANKKEFLRFQKLNYSYKILQHPGTLINPRMINYEDFKKSKSWDFYPTYNAYDSIMQKFQSDYPNLCKIENIGTLPSNRKLLVAKISDSVNISENEPQFLYTSTMHGDETVGYILMLRYIDYLLANYGNNPRITNLVNNIEIWINPLANPDGTYAGGNHTVNGATRNNANHIDFNRNFPDPEDGPNPDGEPWQYETIFFMDFADSNNFVMSANLHGGAEVANYPWDTWAKLHADDNWWEFVSREYADTVHNFSPSGYLMDLDSGITNGYQWYSISGGRQDYMNYFHQCREFTLELSNTKLPQANQLPNYWNWNYRSLLNYMEEVLFGIKGVVTDSITGKPLKAKIFISSHDIDSSHIYSSLPKGNYHRPIYAGTYSLTFSASGYKTKTIHNITIANRSTIVQDVQLAPTNIGINENSIENSVKIFPNPTNGKLTIFISDLKDDFIEIDLLNLQSQYIYSEKIKNKSNEYFSHSLDLSLYSKGIYILKITNNSSVISKKIIIQ